MIAPWRGDASGVDTTVRDSGLTIAAETRFGLWPDVTTRTPLLFVTGITLGPSGLAILTPSLLDLLQPGVAVVLVVLGVIVAVESLSSVTLSRFVPHVVSASIVAAGVAAELAHRPGVDALLSLGRAAVIGIALAGAGWVLSSRSAVDDDRRIFSIATFLLIGGAAEYLAVPAFLTGWLAAVAWRLLRAADLGAAYLDAAYIQGPASALLLVLAGAHVQFSWLTAVLGLAVAVLGALSRVLGRAHVLASGFSLAPTALLAAWLMDAARLNPRVFELLSVLVLASVMAPLFQGRGARRT